jgi:hypothetical protein
MGREPVCITCGQPAGPRRLNRLSDGRVCPTCCDRLLDTLPALLPSRHADLDFEEWAEGNEERGDERGGDDYLEGA